MRVVVSSRYTDPELGPVVVKVHGTTRHIRARWTGNVLTVTIPTNLPEGDFERFMERNRAAILDMRPTEEFYIGRVIDAPLVDFTIAVQNQCNANAGITRLVSKPLRGKKINYTLWLSAELSQKQIRTPQVQEHMRSLIKKAATDASRLLILPRARSIADLHGVKVRKFDIRDTSTRLGSCSSQGNISLASRLIFLPQHLSDYVICHELAHRTYMDHSPAFHSLTDKYCGGTEAQCVSELRKFKWPV